jgi:MFS family permease
MFYGWWIVIIGCIQEAVKGGTFNTGFSVYFLPILTDLNLSRAATSLPFSLAKLEAALEGPLVGYLIDRFDPRLIMVLGTTMAGLGFVLLYFTQSYLFFLLVFMGLLTFGFQAGFNQATMAAVNNWFRKQRGLAMSLVQTGQALGGVVLFPLVALAVLNLGWRHAALLSGGAVFLLLPLLLLIRRTPESMGLLPDGESTAPPHPSHVVIKPPHIFGEAEELTPERRCRPRPSGSWPSFTACATSPTAGSLSTWCRSWSGRAWMSRRRPSSWGCWP